MSFPQGVLVPPSLDSLLQVFRSKDFGTAGEDGWKGCELKHILVESISVFRVLVWNVPNCSLKLCVMLGWLTSQRTKSIFGILAEQNIRPTVDG